MPIARVDFLQHPVHAEHVQPSPDLRWPGPKPSPRIVARQEEDVVGSPGSEAEAGGRKQADGLCIVLLNATRQAGPWSVLLCVGERLANWVGPKRYGRHLPGTDEVSPRLRERLRSNHRKRTLVPFPNQRLHFVNGSVSKPGVQLQSAGELQEAPIALPLPLRLRLGDDLFSRRKALLKSLAKSEDNGRCKAGNGHGGPNMTKSAVSLARAALATGQEALPTYASKFSRKDFTLPQLFAILVLRKFFRTDYRGMVAMLAEWSDLRRVLKLPKVPNYSTLWYAEQKLMKRGLLLGCCPRASIALGASA